MGSLQEGKKEMKPRDKKIKLVKTIRSLISSLESHLEFCYKDSPEGKRFHVTCCKDYAKDIVNLTDILE